MAKDSQKLSKKTAEEPKDLSNPDEILEEDELDEDPEEGEASTRRKTCSRAFPKKNLKQPPMCSCRR